VNSLSATIVITTKNRKVELRQAIQSALEQTAEPEVLIIDDGSTDGTAEMVSTEFPQARLDRSEVSQGLVVQRNRAARLASAPVIFSIDDDAAFSTPFVIEQTLAEFDDPRVAAVAIPYIEPNKSDRVMQRAPSRNQIWVADTYVGTAHALRRDVFLQLGGYREALFHQGEESDFCIRMLDAGYVVRLGNSDLIEHYESPRRDFGRMDFYGPRNAVLFAWQNVPMPTMPVHLMATSIKCILWSWVPRRLLMRLAGLSMGYLAARRFRRRPVSSAAYRLMRDLRRDGPRRLTEIESRFNRVAGKV
jgi:glycosyltransferase involved in cell wall biosynthesis